MKIKEIKKIQRYRTSSWFFFLFTSFWFKFLLCLLFSLLSLFTTFTLVSCKEQNSSNDSQGVEEGSIVKKSKGWDFAENSVMFNPK